MKHSRLVILAGSVLPLLYVALTVMQAQTKLLVNQVFPLAGNQPLVLYLWATDQCPLNTRYTDPVSGVVSTSDAVLCMDQAGQKITVRFRTGEVKTLASPQP